MTAVDTNVLVYARDPRDPAKQAAALNLITSLTDGVLLWQLDCEYQATMQRLSFLGREMSQVREDIDDLLDIWTGVLPVWDVLNQAPALMKRHTLSFWDSTIVAACIDARVQRLMTEDMGATRMIESLQIVNPFESC